MLEFEPGHEQSDEHHFSVTDLQQIYSWHRLRQNSVKRKSHRSRNKFHLLVNTLEPLSPGRAEVAGVVFREALHEHGPHIPQKPDIKKFFLLCKNSIFTLVSHCIDSNSRLRSAIIKWFLSISNDLQIIINF